jgi:hypothetical protein
MVEIRFRRSLGRVAYAHENGGNLRTSLEFMPAFLVRSSSTQAVTLMILAYWGATECLRPKSHFNAYLIYEISKIIIELG